MKDDLTISISGDIAGLVQKHYARDDYSMMVENLFNSILPKPRTKRTTSLSSQLLGCAASSGFVDKTDREIKEIMYKEKYGV